MGERKFIDTYSPPGGCDKGGGEKVNRRRSRWVGEYRLKQQVLFRK